VIAVLSIDNQDVIGPLICEWTRRRRFSSEYFEKFFREKLGETITFVIRAICHVSIKFLPNDVRIKWWTQAAGCENYSLLGMSLFSLSDLSLTSFCFWKHPEWESLMQRWCNITSVRLRNGGGHTLKVWALMHKTDDEIFNGWVLPFTKVN
jgi:hypothetical protein